MKWFMNMKIAAKLLSGFIIVALVAGIIGVVGIFNLNTLEKMDTELFEVNTAPIGIIADVAIAFQRQRVNVRDMVIEIDDTVQQQKDLATIKELDVKVLAGLKEFSTTINNAGMQTDYDSLVKSYDEYIVIRDKLTGFALAKNRTEVLALMKGDAAKTTEVVDSQIQKLIGLKVSLASSKSDSNTATASTASTTMVIIVIGGLIMAIGLGIVLSRIISKPIRELVSVAEKIADGNLDVNVEAKTKDEIGMLSSAFKRMADNLNEVMSNFNSASEQVASGSRQVSASSISLAQGATEQASSIEQLTASIEEISTQTMLNAQNAGQANELAEAAREIAIQGNQQMKGMLQAMEEINDSSGNIFKIIKVIDEIAFQTNILALNAAVEAARAGQHGKGFAVVAEEVRNLAARSANAAKETTEMIEGSIKKVEGGTKIANETALALNKIVEGVSKATTLVAEIATASNEQALGINQVNQGIMQVSSVVQTNSATSEESAAASEELLSQAEMLREQVAKFKLRKTTEFSARGFENLNPEVLQMLEEMSRKQKGNTNYVSPSQGYAEAAATSSKPRISLSNNEFGKY